MAEGALAILAGGGSLPRLLAEDQARRGDSYIVCGFEGQAPGWLIAHPHYIGPFEKPGALFAAMRAAGATRIAFAGGLTRPRLRPLRFDAAGLRLAATVLPLLRKGDDAMLRGLMAVLEREGFEMVGAHELLSELLAPAGVLSARAPSGEDMADIARAAALARMIGAADVGQAAVVERGLCLGLESLQGTDALLDAVAATPPDMRLARGTGALYKGAKPDQDWRADLPAIGPDTLRLAAAAGLGGVAVEAGGVLLLGLEETRRVADEAGLWLYGLTRA